MNEKIMLKDVQPVVFDNIDIRLEKLDQAQNAKAFAARLTNKPETSMLSIPER